VGDEGYLELTVAAKRNGQITEAEWVSSGVYIA
jgi:hypothetical protein